MVTFVGSPPKAEMYFWTHLRANRSVIDSVPQRSSNSRDIPLTILKAEISHTSSSDLVAREEAKCWFVRSVSIEHVDALNHHLTDYERNESGASDEL